MFEKEAKEYEEKAEFIEVDDYGKKVYGSIDIETAYQKGAIDGYNKAKEDADKMKNRFLELCNLKDMRIAELEKANKWHYCKDELPKLRVSTTVSVIVVYLNAFDNPCKIDCFFNGRDFVYWDSSCTMLVKVSEFKGNVYAWKYADELPPKESE